MLKLFSKLFHKSEKPSHPYCSAIVPAAGTSSRMGENKLLMPLAGIPVLARTLQSLDSTELVDEIVIAAREEDLLAFGDLCKIYGITKPVKIVRGGATRLESVLAASVECREDAAYLAVHDGARPLATPELIDSVITMAYRTNAAAPGVPLKDTVKIVQSGKVDSTPDRDSLRAIQTPQVFDGPLLRAALQAAAEAGAEVTDDCAAVERLGKEVYIADGSYENIKITTPEDVAMAGGNFAAKGGAGVNIPRIGYGYDVHRLTEGRPLVLGGETIPFELGLAGHSDADVLLHALMDALLGAAALGDIGHLFPDTDAYYKGIDSRILLRRVAAVLEENGFSVGNVDVTLVAQRPKIAPYVRKMRENIAADLNICVDQVSVKATTEEGLGFTGRGEGMAAHAAALIFQ